MKTFRAIIEASGRAKKGGQIGLNGETYKGGQFLPSSKFTVKGKIRYEKSNIVGVSKEEIEPFKWELSPSPYARSIWALIKGVMDHNHFRKTGEIRMIPDLRDFSPDMKIEPGVKGQKFGKKITWQKFADMYMRGARWIDVRPNKEVDTIK